MVHDLLAKSGLPGCAGFSFFGVFFHGCFDDPAKLLTITDVQLARTTVLHVEAGTGAGCEKLPSDVWLPEPGYNFVA